MTARGPGRVARSPFAGTTRNGKPMTTFTLAAYLPPRTPGTDGTTRRLKVFCFDALASHVATSVVDGDRTVLLTRMRVLRRKRRW